MAHFTDQLFTIAPNNGDYKVVNVQILDFSVCASVPTFIVWVEVTSILQIMHGAAMCILSTAQFVRQSLQMYHVTKRWQLNQYMNLLVSQGILYFTVYVSYFSPLYYAAIDIRTQTYYSNPPSQHVSLQCPPAIGCLGKSPNSVANVTVVYPRICPHIRTGPSIHPEHSGDV